MILPDLSKDLNWSLKPLTLWMRCLGFSFPSDPGFTISCWSQLVRVSIFFIVTSIELGSLVNFIVNISHVSLDYTDGVATDALAWNVIIDSSNLALYVISGNALLLILTQPTSWADLNNSLHQLEHHTLKFYPKFRKIAVFFIMYIITSV